LLFNAKAIDLCDKIAENQKIIFEISIVMKIQSKIVAAVLCFTVVLVGCGQKGDLTLPNKIKGTAAEVPAATPTKPQPTLKSTQALAPAQPQTIEQVDKADLNQVGD
jgi:predicted small lipoprotein YifL